MTSDELCTLVMMVTRSYLVARTLRYLSGIESRQTRGYSNMNNLNITTAMSVRMLYHRFPLELMAALSGLPACLDRGLDKPSAAPALRGTSAGSGRASTPERGAKAARQP